jgi:hypothetical protein
MGFIWFLLGGAVGSVVTAKIGTKAARIGLGVALDKLHGLPDPCLAQVRAAFMDISEADVFNELVREGNLTSEQIAELRRQHPTSTTPFAAFGTTRLITLDDLVREFHPSHEQIEHLIALSTGSDPRRPHVTDEDIAAAFGLTPEQRGRLFRMSRPGPWPAPQAAAGALWMHHGYYDPRLPSRVYGRGLGY